MKCRQVKKNLVNYTAGEYHLFNLEELEAHLSICPDCRRELAGLQEVDRALSRIPDRYLPYGFTAGIIDSLRKSGAPAAPALMKERPSTGFALIKDLLAAAAVTAVLFWMGGDLMETKNVSKASQKLDYAVTAYVNYSGDVMSRACYKIVSFSERFKKELIDDEVQ